MIVSPVSVSTDLEPTTPESVKTNFRNITHFSYLGFLIIPICIIIGIYFNYFGYCGYVYFAFCGVSRRKYGGKIFTDNEMDDNDGSNEYVGR